MADINNFAELKDKQNILTRLKEEVKRSSRYKNKLSVILIELDDYKELKNNLDEKSLNEVEVDFIKLIIHNIREVDLVGRLKPQQFLVLCPNTGIMGAKIAAQRIRKITEFSSFGDSYKITLSAGVKEYIFEEPDKLLNETKKRLNIAKIKVKIGL
ncbi:MAG: diguanylate cyclase [Candidatus Mcinerneyibacterium aminivorans]|uniref:Diguanylate cyclase n=1 Tax=Candidatus Mcinerneyibacterium aminivorans TaxID=2703815 RepID=A0A5D0MGR0_9BACT|nr:MAG: diguanylate cyclase [Candidatus Mcinerneyibacterium aminivorans]